MANGPRKHGLLYVLSKLPRLLKGGYPLFLDYPLHPEPRYGYGKPAHPEHEAMLGREAEAYRAQLAAFLEFEPQLRKIPARSRDIEASWINDWLEGLDTLALYGFVASRRPKTYLEIGSGYSTKVARCAINENRLETRLVSIDPEPRAEVDRICDEVIRQPMEKVALERYAALAPGDILFLDGSHRVFMNSDVAVLFLDVLPRLRPGVLVHIHDIYLPYDYPPERAEWFYSEQYPLAAALLAGHQGFRVVLPNHYVSQHAAVAGVLNEFWSRAELKDVPRGGTSFWLETTA